MSNWSHISLFCFLALSTVTIASAKPSTTSTQVSPVKADWQARALAWFKSTDGKQRRKEMRVATKALRKPCRYCHTPDFKGYTEKRLISQQMMALSVENDVSCTDCHAGKKGLTEIGTFANKMWRWSIEQKLFCNDCHTSKSKFKDLTARGQKSIKAWKKRRKQP